MKKTVFLCVIYLVCVHSGVAHAACGDDGLVAYYPFNGNANDESGCGNDGTVYDAGLAADRFGNPQSAYYFDGMEDYIRIENDETLNPDSISVAAWFQYSEVRLSMSVGVGSEIHSVPSTACFKTMSGKNTGSSPQAVPTVIAESIMMMAARIVPHWFTVLISDQVIGFGS